MKNGYLYREIRALVVIGLAVLWSLPAKSETNFTWQAFQDSGEPGDIAELSHQNKNALFLNGESHYLYRAEQELPENFQLEFDMAGEVLSGVGFSGGDLQNYQFIYFRPQEGDQPTAIQYVPVYHGALNWVLYNAPNYEKPASISPLKWFHITLKVSGSKARIFINNSPKPTAEFTLLPLSNPGNQLIFRSLFGETYIANIHVNTLHKTEEGTEKDNKNIIDSEVASWDISYFQDALFPLSVNSKIISEPAMSSTHSSDPVVNLAQYTDNPNGIAVARTEVNLDKNVNYRMSFDFSGKLQIFVNGEEIFRYQKYKLERIEMDAHQTLIELHKGNNEILVVSEGDAFYFPKPYRSLGRLQHQNWGFTMRLDPMKEM